MLISIFITILAALPLAAFAAETPASSPLTWKGYVLAEDVSNLHGGLRTGSIQTGAGHLVANYDTAAANWWQGGTFVVGVLGIAQTHNQSLYTAAVQTPSNYSAVPEIRISDLNYKHTFNESFAFCLGVMDIDDEFNVTEVASDVLSSGLDNTIALASNVQLATYPFPGIGAYASIGKPILNLKLGIYQANPQHQHLIFKRGAFEIGELSSVLDGDKAINQSFTLKAGVWHNYQKLPWLRTKNNGWYLIGETTWTGFERTLGAALNYGNSSSYVSSIPHSLAACFTVTGLIKSRAKDVLNIAAGRAWIRGTNAENFYEVGYAIVITDKWTLTPDLQYITKPSGIYPNAWVGLLRLNYSIG